MSDSILVALPAVLSVLASALADFSVALSTPAALAAFCVRRRGTGFLRGFGAVASALPPTADGVAVSVGDALVSLVLDVADLAVAGFLRAAGLRVRLAAVFGAGLSLALTSGLAGDCSLVLRLSPLGFFSAAGLSAGLAVASAVVTRVLALLEPSVAGLVAVVLL